MVENQQRHVHGHLLTPEGLLQGRGFGPQLFSRQAPSLWPCQAARRDRNGLRQLFCCLRRANTGHSNCVSPEKHSIEQNPPSAQSKAHKHCQTAPARCLRLLDAGQRATTASPRHSGCPRDTPRQPAPPSAGTAARFQTRRGGRGPQMVPTVLWGQERPEHQNLPPAPHQHSGQPRDLHFHRTICLGETVKIPSPAAPSVSH